MTHDDHPKYIINVEKAQGLIIGDNLHVEQHFHDASSPPPPLSRDELLDLFHQSGSEFDLYNDRIAGIRLERAEVDRIIDWALKGDPKQRLGMLFDQAGGGKTVVMRHVRQRLMEARVPVLAIKADILPDLHTRDDLSQWLKLPLPVEDCVSQLTGVGPIVVLIDQLDALSLALSRDRTNLDIMLDTIARLHRVEGVRIVASCRTFDLHNDPRLSTIPIDQEFRLQPLDHTQIKQILDQLGIAFERLLPAHQTLLAVPLHLAIYVQVMGEVKPQTIENFYSLQGLYDALWQKRIVATLSAPPSSQDRHDAIYKLVDAMQERRETKVPIATLDEYAEATNYLETVGFIRRDHGNWHFVHQTLFDYCYARRFVAQSRSLSREILSGPQGLFERSQIVQVLAHLRGINEGNYRRELITLLFADRLRVHLRVLIIGWLGSLRDPSDHEFSIARRLISNPNYHARFLSAMSGNEAWFDLLHAETLPSLLRLQSDEPIEGSWRFTSRRKTLVDIFQDLIRRFLNRALRLFGKVLKIKATSSTDFQPIPPVIIYLSTLMQVRAQAIVDLLRPFLGRSDVWDTRIAFCLSYLDEWNHEVAIEMVCNLLRRGRMGGRVDLVLYKLSKSNPAAACRAVRAYLDHRLETLLAHVQSDDRDSIDSFSWGHELFGRHDGYATREVLDRAVQECPDKVIEYLLPWFVQTAQSLATPHGREHTYPSDSVFGWGWYGEHIMEGAVFARYIARALQHLAKNRPSDFRVIATDLSQVEALAVQRVLVYAYLAHPETYGADIFDYLVADRRRLHIGDIENTSYESCQLFSAAFEYSDADHRNVLEHLILAYQSEGERISPRHKDSIQFRFLKSVRPELLNEKARRVLVELERKFPGYEIRPPQGVTVGAVGPPIEHVVTP